MNEQRHRKQRGISGGIILFAVSGGEFDPERLKIGYISLQG